MTVCLQSSEARRGGSQPHGGRAEGGEHQQQERTAQGRARTERESKFNFFPRSLLYIFVNVNQVFLSPNKLFLI